MFSFHNIPIRRKFTLVMMLTSSAALLLAGIAFLANDILSMRRAMGEELATLTEMVSANSTAAVIFHDARSANETLGFLHLQPHIISATIHDNNGEIFASYQRNEGLQPTESEAWPWWENYIELERPIVLDGDQLGSITIRSDTARMHARLLWYAGIATAVFLVSMLAAFILSARLQRVVTDPILRLAHTARRVSSEEDYTLRAQREGNDELGDLIDGFNEMLAEIQARDMELDLHREQLEDMVSRRTAELEAANAQLALAKEHAESAAEKMAHQAYHDALTGLPNRALLNDRLVLALAHAYREAEMLAVLFLDLDRFKVINDSLGHAFGDQLLCSVTKRLLQCVRADDTVARVGGDEFMILLPTLEDADDAGQVAQKIIDMLKEPFVCEGHELHITTSIGISIYPDDGTDSGTLMKQADISMYRAKERGRNNYLYYTADMDAQSHHRLIMENNLRRALGRNELQVFFQPRIHTQSGELLGTEALLRWHHPEMGMVPPAQFIPLAEETGLIVPIGEWLLRAACAQTRAWQQAGHSDLRIAVNISARQLGKRYLLDIIKRVLAETRMAADTLELEITESVVMQNARSTITTLKELKQMGIRLSIDDFGTGYSSLSYLRRFPIDTIKIDSSFVHEIPHNAEDVSIARAIIAMAHSLKLSVVAEGVENDLQLQFFREHACDEVQGYLLGAPVPADEISRRLQIPSPATPLGMSSKLS